MYIINQSILSSFFFLRTYKKNCIAVSIVNAGCLAQFCSPRTMIMSYKYELSILTYQVLCRVRDFQLLLSLSLSQCPVSLTL